MLDDTEIGGSNESVNHELNEIFHLKRYLHSPNFNLILCKFFCLFNNIFVLLKRQVVTLLKSLQSATDFWKNGNVAHQVV